MPPSALSDLSTSAKIEPSETLHSGAAENSSAAAASVASPPLISTAADSIAATPPAASATSSVGSSHAAHPLHHSASERSSSASIMSDSRRQSADSNQNRAAESTAASSSSAPQQPTPAEESLEESPEAALLGVDSTATMLESSASPSQQLSRSDQQSSSRDTHSSDEAAHSSAELHQSRSTVADISASSPLPPPPLTDAASSAAASVSVEDVSHLKCCSQCRRDLTSHHFSGAQLKKRGKRVCKQCVDKQRAAEFDAATQSTALDETLSATSHDAQPSSPSASSASSEVKQQREASGLTSKSQLSKAQLAQQKADQAVAKANTRMAQSCCSVCFEAASKRVKLKSCNKCLSAYCSLDCLKMHSELCEAIRTMPPLTLAEGDYFTSEEDVQSEFIRFLREMKRDLDELNDRPSGRDAFRCCIGRAQETAGPWNALCASYPPKLGSPFWIEGLRGRELVQEIFFFVMQICSFLYIITGVYEGATDDGERDPLLLPQSMPNSRLILERGVAWERSDFIHRALSVLRFFFTHLHPSNMHQKAPRKAGQSKLEASVKSPWCGSVTVIRGGVSMDNLVYVRAVDRFGRLRLTPLTHFIPKLSSQEGDDFASAPGSEGITRGVPLIGGSKFSLDAGLLIRSQSASRSNSQHCLRKSYTEEQLSKIPMLSTVQALAGAYHLEHPFRSSAFQLVAFDVAYIKLRIEMGVSPAEQAQCEAALEARASFSGFDISSHIKRILDDDFLKLDSWLFVPMPSHYLEQELAELLLLESIVAEAESGSVECRLLLSHVEAETQLPIAEVVSRQKSRLEQMLEDQQAQLTIHAEAVERHNQRAKLKITADSSSESKADESTSAAAPAQSSATAAPSESKEHHQSSSRTTQCAARDWSTALAALKSNDPHQIDCTRIVPTTSASSESQSASRYAPPTPDWMSGKSVSALLSEGRVKFRHFKKLVMAVVHHAGDAALHLESRVNQSGSHIVVHRGAG